ncbi:MAG TPA: lipoprotein insertase outer membrane protein LolB, partial [Gammaproteobacteria bacterium]|nr:lipoprotein insertase outer membrane protein LolB [Gammaproteobacteria bacterium]
MKTIKTVILSAILSTLLISCTITPPPSAIQTNPEVRYRQLISLKTWNIQGVIALNSARDSGSANLHWQQNGQTFNLSLFGPFGANAIQIFGSSAKVTLVNSNGQTFHAKNAEQLLYEQTGWQLP